MIHRIITDCNGDATTARLAVNYLLQSFEKQIQKATSHSHQNQLQAKHCSSVGWRGNFGSGKMNSIFILWLLLVPVSGRRELREKVKNIFDFTAANAGTSCLKTMADLFFYNPEITRSRNMVILHTLNMTSPAAEIEEFFIKWLHTRLLHGENDGSVMSMRWLLWWFVWCHSHSTDYNCKSYRMPCQWTDWSRLRQLLSSKRIITFWWLMTLTRFVWKFWKLCLANF